MEEMKALILSLVPDFKSRAEKLFITHADVDHCGLLSEFDEVILSEESAEAIVGEWNGLGGAREKNPLHKPYANICKILTDYAINKANLSPIRYGGDYAPILTQIGVLRVGELCFEVYRGAGGHLQGETILIDYEHKVAFTGDVYVNLHDMTKKQAEYNRYAPILMTSVDTDPTLAKRVREAVLARLGEGEWSIFGGHGNKKIHTTKTVK